MAWHKRRTFSRGAYTTFHDHRFVIGLFPASASASASTFLLDIGARHLLYLFLGFDVVRIYYNSPGHPLFVVEHRQRNSVRRCSPVAEVERPIKWAKET